MWTKHFIRSTPHVNVTLNSTICKTIDSLLENDGPRSSSGSGSMYLFFVNGFEFDARWAFSGDVTTCPTCVLIQISLVVKSGDIFYFYSRMLFCDCPYVTKTGDVDSSDLEDCKLLGELFQKSCMTRRREIHF